MLFQPIPSTCGFSLEKDKGKICNVILEKKNSSIHCSTYCNEEYKNKIQSLLNLEDLSFYLSIDDVEYDLRYDDANIIITNPTNRYLFKHYFAKETTSGKTEWENYINNKELGNKSTLETLDEILKIKENMSFEISFDTMSKLITKVVDISDKIPVKLYHGTEIITDSSKNKTFNEQIFNIKVNKKRITFTYTCEIYPLHDGKITSEKLKCQNETEPITSQNTKLPTLDELLKLTSEEFDDDYLKGSERITFLIYNQGNTKSPIIECFNKNNLINYWKSSESFNYGNCKMIEEYKLIDPVTRGYLLLSKSQIFNNEHGNLGFIWSDNEKYFANNNNMVFIPKNGSLYVILRLTGTSYEVIDIRDGEVLGHFPKSSVENNDDNIVLNFESLKLHVNLQDLTWIFSVPKPDDLSRMNYFVMRINPTVTEYILKDSSNKEIKNYTKDEVVFKDGNPIIKIEETDITGERSALVIPTFERYLLEKWIHADEKYTCPQYYKIPTSKGNYYIDYKTMSNMENLFRKYETITIGRNDHEMSELNLDNVPVYGVIE
jgi:hypothetical protein